MVLLQYMEGGEGEHCPRKLQGVSDTFICICTYLIGIHIFQRPEDVLHRLHVSTDSCLVINFAGRSLRYQESNKRQRGTAAQRLKG